MTEHAEFMAQPATAGDELDARPARLLIGIFAVLAAGIVGTGFLLQRSFEARYRARVEHELLAVAELKVKALVAWRAEREADAAIFVDNPAFSASVRRLLANPADESAQATVRDWFTRMGTNQQYRRLSLVDVTGAERLALAGDGPGGDPTHAPAVGEAVSERRPWWIDTHRNLAGGDVHLDVVAPLTSGSSGTERLGAVVLRIDAAAGLYPLIEGWPAPSRTGEVTIARRDGDDVVILSPLRFQPGAPLATRVPVTHGERPVVQAALGVEGIVYGRNYRGEPAVAAVRAIPGSPWVLVARMDEAEAFAVVRTRLWVTLLMVGLLVTGAGAGVRTIWQGHRLRGRADLRDRDRHLTVIADNFPGLVARLDRDLRYRFASAGFEHRFGVPAASLVGRRMPDVIGREAWEVARPHAARALAGERAAYEDTLTSASGERLRMLVTLVPDLDAADVVQGIFVVALDITERHRAQEALRSSEERYRRTLDSMREGFQIIGRDWRYVYVNDAAAGHGRRPKDDLLGRTMMEVYPGIEGTAMFAALRRCMEDREFQAFENEFTYPDGTSAWFDLSIDPVPDGISVISLDVTERHRAAEELRVSRERIRELAFAQEETREAERKRLAAELHDELGGALTGIKMDLSWLADRFDTNAREFRDRASEAMKLVDTTVNTVRRMSAELRPGVLDDLGLAAAIQWQVRDFQRRSGLAVRVSGLDAVPPLDAGRTLAVFRILQEALTNVARHARATQIVITVVVADGRLRMEVHDDGQGPRASVSGHREGLGVLGMQERAAAWGGTVTIREDRPRGTVVTLDMPLHPRSPEAS